MYDKPGISILLSSDMDFPDLVAEIYWEGGLIATIRKDGATEQYFAEYQSHEKGPDRFIGPVPLDVLIDAIDQAKRRLA